jgi:hypothetical protein
MSQKEKIAEISDKIYDYLWDGSTALSVFAPELDKIPVKEFLAYNFKTYPEIYIKNYLMYAYENYWKKLSLKDWEDIVKAIDKNELALFSCLTFLYITLEIDSINLYKNMENVDEITKRDVLKYFTERPGVLSDIKKYNLKVLEKFGLDTESFKQTSDKLIREGVMPAAKVKPEIFKLFDSGDIDMN